MGDKSMCEFFNPETGAPCKQRLQDKEGKTTQFENICNYIGQCPKNTNLIRMMIPIQTPNDRPKSEHKKCFIALEHDYNHLVFQMTELN